MSATNRGAARRPNDWYATPAWCVEALLRVWQPVRERCFALEPCAGDGAIVDAVDHYYLSTLDPHRVSWDAYDIAPQLQDSPGGTFIDTFDFLSVEPRSCYEFIITNPPYSIAQEIVEHALKFKGADVVMLLRLNFLASAKRAHWLRQRCPDVYVLPNRPSFTGDGVTDSIDYAWFIWPHGRAEFETGKVRVLEPVPKARRKP